MEPPSRSEVTSLLKKICEKLPENQRGAFGDSVTARLLDEYDKPKTVRFKEVLALEDAPSKGAYLGALFFPRPEDAKLYVDILGGRWEGGSGEGGAASLAGSLQIPFLVMLYLNHTYGDGDFGESPISSPSSSSPGKLRSSDFLYKPTNV